MVRASVQPWLKAFKPMTARAPVLPADSVLVVRDILAAPAPARARACGNQGVLHHVDDVEAVLGPQEQVVLGVVGLHGPVWSLSLSSLLSLLLSLLLLL